jgi:hypothetical protein
MLLLRARGSGGVCLTALHHRVRPSLRRLGTCRARLRQLTAASSVRSHVVVDASVVVDCSAVLSALGSGITCSANRELFIVTVCSSCGVSLYARSTVAHALRQRVVRAVVPT